MKYALIFFALLAGMWIGYRIGHKAQPVIVEGDPLIGMRLKCDAGAVEIQRVVPDKQLGQDLQVIAKWWRQ